MTDQHQHPRLRVVLAEDAVVLRDGLAELLGAYGHEVVAAVADAGALLAAVAECRPDVTVVDIRMPPTHTDEGLRAAVELRRAYPRLGVLVFSQYIEARYATDLLAVRSGGVGYLLKERVTDVRSFMSALTRVAAGETVLDPDVVVQLAGANRRRETLDRLTAREQEVLGLMAEGPLEHRDRPAARHQRRNGGEAHQRHLREVRAGRGRHRSPAGAGGAALPQGLRVSVTRIRASPSRAYCAWRSKPSRVHRSHGP